MRYGWTMIRYMRAPKTSHAALIAALVAASLAGLLALGPFGAAVINSIIVEVEIAQAAQLPVAQFLPAALDGMGGLALIALAVLPAQEGRRALWAMVLAALVASMAANGAHAIVPRDDHGLLELPWYAALGVAFVAPLSAAASAHILLRIGARVAALVQAVLWTAPAPRDQRPPADPPPPRTRRSRSGAPNARVLELVRGGAGYRGLMAALGMKRGEAEEAVRVARAHLGLPTRGRRAEVAA